MIHKSTRIIEKCIWIDFAKMNKTMPLKQGYWIFETKDERRYHGIAGGLMKRQNPQQIVANYLRDALIDEYSSKINQSAGQVIFSKTRLQDMGHTAMFWTIRT